MRFFTLFELFLVVVTFYAIFKFEGELRIIVPCLCLVTDFLFERLRKRIQESQPIQVSWTLNATTPMEDWKPKKYCMHNLSLCQRVLTILLRSAPLRRSLILLRSGPEFESELALLSNPFLRSSPHLLSLPLLRSLIRLLSFSISDMEIFRRIIPERLSKSSLVLISICSSASKVSFSYIFGSSPI